VEETIPWVVTNLYHFNEKAFFDQGCNIETCFSLLGKMVPFFVQSGGEKSINDTIQFIHNALKINMDLVPLVIHYIPLNDLLGGP